MLIGRAMRDGISVHRSGDGGKIRPPTMDEELCLHRRELARLGGSPPFRVRQVLDVRGSLAWEEAATCRWLACLGRASDGAVVGERRETSIRKENNESFSS
jgi:hypothetical protein